MKQPPSFFVFFAELYKKQLLECGNTQVFPESDSVETLAYDPVHLRLVVSSHFGKIQAYTVEKGGDYQWACPLVGSHR